MRAFFVPWCDKGVHTYGSGAHVIDPPWNSGLNYLINNSMLEVRAFFRITEARTHMPNPQECCACERRIGGGRDIAVAAAPRRYVMANRS